MGRSSAGSSANDGSKLDQKDSLILGREMEELGLFSLALNSLRCLHCTFLLHAGNLPCLGCSRQEEQGEVKDLWGCLIPAVVWLGFLMWGLLGKSLLGREMPWIEEIQEVGMVSAG